MQKFSHTFGLKLFSSGMIYKHYSLVNGTNTIVHYFVPWYARKMNCYKIVSVIFSVSFSNENPSCISYTNVENRLGGPLYG